MAFSGDGGVTGDASRALLVRCTVDVGPRVSACSLSLLASGPRSSPSNVVVCDPTRSAILACCCGDLQIVLLESIIAVEVESSCYMTLELALPQERMYRVSKLGKTPMQQSSCDRLTRDD